MIKGREIPILPILLMIGIAAGGYGLYKVIEFEEHTYFVSQSPEARKNPYLAASRLLEKQGFETSLAENRSVFTRLDVDTTGVLLLADLDELEDPREADKLLEWVESGGILLTSPGGYHGFDQTSVAAELLAHVGVESLEDVELTDDQDAYSNDSELFDISLPDKDVSNQLTIHTDYSPYFINRATNEGGITTLIDSPVLVHKSVGKGYISLYSDPGLFNNIKLEEVDHAYTFMWLTQPAVTKSMQVVYRPAGKPGFLKFVWNRFTASILIAALVLLGYLRWASSRLGPVEQELPPINNNLMAHLEARGEFWYRHKYTSDVVGNVQRSTLEELALKQGKPRDRHSKGDADRAHMIRTASKILKCSAREAEQVLYAETPGDARILKTTQALQKLNHQKLFNQQNLTE